MNLILFSGLVLIIISIILVIMIIVKMHIKKIELDEITKTLNTDTKKPNIRVMAKYNSEIIHGGKIT